MQLNIEIQNFGKISSAQIMIKPLTIITGLNSSGKSFITRGLYSILHALNQDIVSEYLINKLGVVEYLIDELSYNIPRRSKKDIEIINVFSNLLKSVRNGIYRQFNFINLLQSNDLLSSLVPQIKEMQDFLVRLRDQLKIGKGTKWKRVENDFYDLINEMKDLHNGLEKWKEVYISSLEVELKKSFLENFQTNNISNLISNGKYSLFKLNNNMIKLNSNSNSNSSNKIIEFSINQILLSDTYKLKNVVYLESSIYFRIRSALNEVRFNSLNMRLRGAIPAVPKYFYDVDELLNANLPAVSKELDKIAEKIENIINGKIIITQNGDLVYQENGRLPVSMNMASSGISNLGMIALLLRRNVLNIGSFLFIDEPEMNLHTTWQLFMLDILFELSEAGVNVVIATHSLDMLHRLEFIVEKMTDNSIAEKISINRLSKDGRTEANLGDALLEINEAKQILGRPYVDVMRERLP